MNTLAAISVARDALAEGRYGEAYATFTELGAGDARYLRRARGARCNVDVVNEWLCRRFPVSGIAGDGMEVRFRSWANLVSTVPGASGVFSFSYGSEPVTA